MCEWEWRIGCFLPPQVSSRLARRQFFFSWFQPRTYSTVDCREKKRQRSIVGPTVAWPVKLFKLAEWGPAEHGEPRFSLDTVRIASERRPTDR